MSIYERITLSQEPAFIALRANGLLGITLIGLAVLTLTVLPSIVA